MFNLSYILFNDVLNCVILLLNFSIIFFKSSILFYEGKFVFTVASLPTELTYLIDNVTTPSTETRDTSFTFEVSSRSPKKIPVKKSEFFDVPKYKVFGSLFFVFTIST